MRKSNGHSVSHGGATVTDADTFTPPAGRLVRAFVERLHEPQPVMYLLLPQDLAMHNLASYLAGSDSRIECMPRGAEPPEPTAWRLADLAPAALAAWDREVTRLGGQPWHAVYGLPSTLDSTEEVAGSNERAAGA